MLSCILQKTCQGKTLDATGLCRSAMGAAGSYSEAPWGCQPMTHLFQNHGPPRLMLHCQGGEHISALRAGRVAPTLGNLGNSRPRGQMATKGHVSTTQNNPQGWLLGLCYCNSSRHQRNPWGVLLLAAGHQGHKGHLSPSLPSTSNALSSVPS